MLGGFVALVAVLALSLFIFGGAGFIILLPSIGWDGAVGSASRDGTTRGLAAREVSTDRGKSAFAPRDRFGLRLPSRGLDRSVFRLAVAGLRFHARGRPRAVGAKKETPTRRI
ncbi:MAG: hypothetical protein AAF799_32165 [Myxococcota bacterium]